MCCAVGVLGSVRQEPTTGSKRLRLCETDTTAGIAISLYGITNVTADSQILSKGYRLAASVLLKKSHQYSMETELTK